jgi:hypothetical protein
MRTFLAAIAVCLAVTPAVRAVAQAPARLAPAASPAPPAMAGGSVRSDRMALELLPPRTGNEIRTPEGFIRLEGSGAAPASLVSFGTYRPVPPQVTAAARGTPVVARTEAAEGAPGGDGSSALSAAASPARDPCRGQRSRYVRRLLTMSGIDLDDPLAFLEGMTGSGGYPAHYLFTAVGLLPGSDPIRPLAWDLELRSIARELAACSRASER